MGLFVDFFLKLKRKRSSGGSLDLGKNELANYYHYFWICWQLSSKWILLWVKFGASSSCFARKKHSTGEGLCQPWGRLRFFLLEAKWIAIVLAMLYQWRY